MQTPLQADLWQQAFDRTFIAMVLADPGGRLHSCNVACAALLGYSSSELRKKTLRDVTHPQDYNDLAAGLEQLRTDRDADVHVCFPKLITKAGGLIEVRLVVAALRTENTLAGVSMTLEPVTKSDMTVSRQTGSASLLDWCRTNPKDTIIIVLAAVLLLGKDAVQKLLEHLLSP